MRLFTILTRSSFDNSDLNYSSEKSLYSLHGIFLTHLIKSYLVIVLNFKSFGVFNMLAFGIVTLVSLYFDSYFVEKYFAS